MRVMSEILISSQGPKGGYVNYFPVQLQKMFRALPEP